MLVYPATFEPDDNYILVQFPDIPEAFTQGESTEEAYLKAAEVLGAILEDKTEFPKASTLKEIYAQYPKKDVALIGIDLATFRRKYHSKTVRKNVTVPEWLANIAELENINFSQTLTEALKEKLGV